MLTVLGLALAGVVFGFLVHAGTHLFLGPRAKTYIGGSIAGPFVWGMSRGLGFLTSVGLALCGFVGHVLWSKAYQWWVRRKEDPLTAIEPTQDEP